MIDFDKKENEKECHDCSDFELISLFKETGGDKVFKELYIRYKDMIYSYIRNFLYKTPENIAEELLNDVFIRVYLKLTELKEANAFKYWLFKITRTICLNYIKSFKGDYISLDNELNPIKTNDLSDQRINIEEDYLSHELTDILYNEINKLEKQEREIIILKYFDKLTYEEIAEITNISVRTAKRKVEKCLIILNQNIKNKEMM